MVGDGGWSSSDCERLRDRAVSSTYLERKACVTYNKTFEPLEFGIICKLEKIYLEALGGTELFDDFTFVKDAKRPIADRNLAV